MDNDMDEATLAFADGLAWAIAAVTRAVMPANLSVEHCADALAHLRADLLETGHRRSMISAIEAVEDRLRHLDWVPPPVPHGKPRFRLIQGSKP